MSGIRKLIPEKFDFDVSCINGRVVDAIRVLQEYVDKYGDSLTIDIDIDHGYWNERPSIEINCQYLREETDAELKRRIARQDRAREKARANREIARVKASEQRAAAQEAELKEYQRLHDKYGSLNKTTKNTA